VGHLNFYDDATPWMIEVALYGRGWEIVLWKGCNFGYVPQ
jgi:hypothetical protein